MELYTKEQVREIINRAELNRHLTYGDVLDGIFPIVLPSDQEIEKEAFQVPYNGSNEFYDKSFIRGAKWVIEQITKAKKNDDKKWWEITEYEYHEYWSEIKDRFGITQDLCERDPLEYLRRYPKFDKPHSDYFQSMGFNFFKIDGKDWEQCMLKGDWEIRCGGNGWYTVREWETDNYYKCDGFDGLKDFLQHHKI